MFYVDDDQKANFTLSYDFPLIVHETNLKDKPQGYNDWHWHEELQFSYVLEGEMITTCQGEDFLLGKGSAIFLNTNNAHMSRPSSQASARYLSLNIQPSLLTLFHESVVEQKYYLPYINWPGLQVVPFYPDEEMGRVLLREIRELFCVLAEKDFGYEMEAYGRLLHLWRGLLLYTEHSDRIPAQPERQEAHDMLTYLHGHYSENITLDDIADRVHMSKGECCRMFKSAYGCSIFTHLLNYRIAQSIPLLTETGLSMSEIAERCGFNSPSYFAKSFREKVKKTPLQYRKDTQGQKHI